MVQEFYVPQIFYGYRKNTLTYIFYRVWDLGRPRTRRT